MIGSLLYSRDNVKNYSRNIPSYLVNYWKEDSEDNAI